MHDLVIHGATVVDGLGHDPIRTDLAVRDGRISRLYRGRRGHSSARISSILRGSSRAPSGWPVSAEPGLSTASSTLALLLSIWRDARRQAGLSAIARTLQSRKALIL